MDETPFDVLVRCELARDLDAAVRALSAREELVAGRDVFTARFEPLQPKVVDIIGGGLALAWLSMFAGMLAQSGVHALVAWHRRRHRLPIARVVR